MYVGDHKSALGGTGGSGSWMVEYLGWVGINAVDVMDMLCDGMV